MDIKQMMKNIKQTLFESGEITFVQTQTGNYHKQEYVLGVAGSMMVAIDRQLPKEVVFVPLTAVQAIGVEYDNSQIAVQDTLATETA